MPRNPQDNAQGGVVEGVVASEKDNQRGRQQNKHWRYGNRSYTPKGNYRNQHHQYREREGPVTPDEFGLGDYAESQPCMPIVSEDIRYAIRDVTAKKVMQQLNRVPSKIDEWTDYESAAQRIVQDALSAADGPKALPLAVRKQFELAQLFTDDPKVASSGDKSATSKGSSKEPALEVDKDLESPTSPDARPNDKNLLGKFDCMAVPVRADYNASFTPFAQSSASASAGDAPQTSGEVLPDCDGPNGFVGWFFVVHVGAPNIGESETADDFQAYARQEYSNNSAEPIWRLDEDLYLEDVQRLWRNAIIAMGRLGVDHGVLFPFGMGAFLRQLGKTDDRYRDAARMRRLRRKIADQLMIAISNIYANYDPTSANDGIRKDPKKAVGSDDIRYPNKLHLCLICINAVESIENHNVFIEAAGNYVKTMPHLASLLQFRRNVDVLQLAQDLASNIKEPLKVAILNAANRKLLGNHWFQKGGIVAIDENIHRRSVSMARAALLLNTGVIPRERRPTELAEAVHWLGGKVTQLIDDRTGGVAVLNTSQNRSSKLWCCKRRSTTHTVKQQAVQRANSTASQQKRHSKNGGKWKSTSKPPMGSKGSSKQVPKETTADKTANTTAAQDRDAKH